LGGREELTMGVLSDETGSFLSAGKGMTTLEYAVLLAMLVFIYLALTSVV
jgi:hypothetical protein